MNGRDYSCRVLALTLVLGAVTGCEQSGTAPEVPLAGPDRDIRVIDLSPPRAAFPNPRPDTATVKPLQAVVIHVLANDADTVTITRIVPDSTAGTVVQKVAVVPTVVRISQPDHGVAQLNSNGSVTYRGTNALFWGVDRFTYTVVNRRGLAASTTVTVEVEAGWEFGLRWPPPDSVKNAGGH